MVYTLRRLCTVIYAALLEKLLKPNTVVCVATMSRRNSYCVWIQCLELHLVRELGAIHIADLGTSSNKSRLGMNTVLYSGMTEVENVSTVKHNVWWVSQSLGNNCLCS